MRPLHGGRWLCRSNHNIILIPSLWTSASYVDFFPYMNTNTSRLIVLSGRTSNCSATDLQKFSSCDETSPSVVDGLSGSHLGSFHSGVQRLDRLSKTSLIHFLDRQGGKGSSLVFSYELARFNFHVSSSLSFWVCHVEGYKHHDLEVIISSIYQCFSRL